MDGECRIVSMNLKGRYNDWEFRKYGQKLVDFVCTRADVLLGQQSDFKYSFPRNYKHIGSNRSFIAYNKDEYVAVSEKYYKEYVEELAASKKIPKVFLPKQNFTMTKIHRTGESRKKIILVSWFTDDFTGKRQCMSMFRHLCSHLSHLSKLEALPVLLSGTFQIDPADIEMLLPSSMVCFSYKAPSRRRAMQYSNLFVCSKSLMCKKVGLFPLCKINLMRNGQRQKMVEAEDTFFYDPIYGIIDTSFHKENPDAVNDVSNDENLEKYLQNILDNDDILQKNKGSFYILVGSLKRSYDDWTQIMHLPGLKDQADKYKVGSMTKSNPHVAASPLDYINRKIKATDKTVKHDETCSRQRPKDKKHLSGSKIPRYCKTKTTSQTKSVRGKSEMKPSVFTPDKSTDLNESGQNKHSCPDLSQEEDNTFFTSSYSLTSGDQKQRLKYSDQDINVNSPEQNWNTIDCEAVHHVPNDSVTQCPSGTDNFPNDSITQSPSDKENVSNGLLTHSLADAENVSNSSLLHVPSGTESIPNGSFVQSPSGKEYSPSGSLIQTPAGKEYGPNGSVEKSPPGTDDNMEPPCLYENAVALKCDPKETISNMDKKESLSDIPLGTEISSSHKMSVVEHEGSEMLDKQVYIKIRNAFKEFSIPEFIEENASLKEKADQGCENKETSKTFSFSRFISHIFISCGNNKS